MKKVYKIEVDCALCATKVESSIAKIEGINEVSINFMTQKMIIDLDENKEKELLKEIIKVARKIEPDFEILK